MKKHHAGIGLLLGGLLAMTVTAQDPAAERGKPTVVVGTFDSRGVLVAYVHSGGFEQHMRELFAELDRAKAAGDEKRVAELEALGPAMQEKIHQQGFGTAPIDDIIAKIEDSLPGIAREAGVDVIVSKWSLFYTSPAAKFVDVTDRLVDEFDPDEATLASIRELLAQDPVPLEEIHEDH